MTNNVFCKCNSCGTVFRLRSQIGYFDIPIFFICPDCQTEISGKVLISQNEIKIDYNLINATICNIKDVSAKYVLEQSVEFPTRKISDEIDYKDPNTFKLSPFMQSMQHLNGDMNIMIKIMKFTKSREQAWIELKTMQSLYENEKLDILKTKLTDICENQHIENKIDMMMLVHHLFIMVFSDILPKNTIQEYLETADKIGDIFKNNRTAFVDFANYMKKDNKIVVCKKNIRFLLDRFYNSIEKFLPVFSLVLADTYDNIDKNEFGISTIGYSEMSSLYSDSYEEILRLLDIAMALNNLFTRNSYTSMPLNCKITYEKFSTMTKKYNKINEIDSAEPFSKVLHLDNHIRNAIAHYSVNADSNNQTIHFNDTYGGNTNCVNVSFIDFARMCIDNFYLLIYFNELIYHIQKFMLLLDGDIPHIWYGKDNPFKTVANKKIGRNEKCTCGSGKKYKHCCGANNSNSKNSMPNR